MPGLDLSGDPRLFFNSFGMWPFKPKNPEEHRYYLLPGQGRGNRIKRRQQFFWACVAGALVAGIFGFVVWWVNTPHL